jgi:two-component sensor histidine kinase/CheY-like chemotaxis protein
MLDKPIQALLVEDNPGDARLLREMLGELESSSVRLTHAARLAAAQELLTQTRFDVILLDLLLPDAQGFATFAQAKDQAPRVPIVVLTGVQDEALAVKAVRQGAQDYLVKGRFDAELLVRAMRYAIERKRIDEELRQHREHLAELVEERTAELLQANQDLQYEISERRKAEQQLRASLQEKEVLVREIHDRVKNNLQVIASLLDMQSIHTQNLEARHVLRESQNRVRTMAMALEILYQQQNLATIDLGSYVHSIVSYLFSVYENSRGSIEADIQVDDIQLDLNTAVACGMIINELVSNALKHAFPAHSAAEGGMIRVELRSQDHRGYTLTVSDNGIGLAPEVDPQSQESLGLRVAHMLSQQLQGTMEVDRQGGTTFRLVFPAPAGG